MKIKRAIMTNYRDIIIIALIITCSLSMTTCNLLSIFKFRSYKYKYTGDVNLSKYEWLKDKRIFLDPGYGGKGYYEQFRSEPVGIAEGEINLRVAMILKDMLEKAGAMVSLSRERDADAPLREHVDMAVEFMPDLLISMHHGRSARLMDEVNYPVVLIWGNKKVRPLSYIFAEFLLDEFQRIMDEKGAIVSDFAVYKEIGTMILRETRYICPGVIGEPGFFSDPKHAIRLNDIQYNTEEAEAYFYAIARFFERGIPRAEVLISSPMDNESYLCNLIRDDNPTIAIRVDSGRKGLGIIKSSLLATLDGIPVKCRAAFDNLFFIDYGKKLYPGEHNIRFSFKNQRHQSSMIYSAGFTVEIKKGDYDRFITEGIRLLKNGVKRIEGLKMLLSALSIGATDSDAGRIIWNIAKGYNLIGDKENSNYYYAKLYYFYPQSKYAKMLERRFKGYRFPIEYNGKYINIKYEPSLKDESKK